MVLIELTYQYTYWHNPWYPWTYCKYMFFDWMFLTCIAVVLCPVLTTTLCLDRVGRASTPLSTTTTPIKSSIICVSNSHTLYSHFKMEQTFYINICKWLSRLFQLIISSLKFLITNYSASFVCGLFLLSVCNVRLDTSVIRTVCTFFFCFLFGSIWSRCWPARSRLVRVPLPGEQKSALYPHLLCEELWSV